LSLRQADLERAFSLLLHETFRAVFVVYIIKKLSKKENNCMKKLMLLAFVLLLGGCSAKFAYNNVDWLIHWYIDDYVELNNAQEDMFDDMLGNWMLWHRQQELPQYKRQLSDIVTDIKNNNITEQSITQHRERAREHWVRARSHVAPDLVALGATLSQEQVIYLFANLEKRNVEDEEELKENQALSSNQRVEKWIERNQKGMRRWLGKLSDEQEAFIATFYQRFESTRPFWLAYKREYQQQLRQVFALAERDETFEQKMHELIVNPGQFRSLEFKTAMKANTAAGSEYLIGLMSLTSTKQIERLLDEIDDLQDDLRGLQR